jgi:hypothetical protein
MFGIQISTVSDPQELALLHLTQNLCSRRDIVCDNSYIHRLLHSTALSRFSTAHHPRGLSFFRSARIDLESMAPERIHELKEVPESELCISPKYATRSKGHLVTHIVSFLLSTYDSEFLR